MTCLGVLDREKRDKNNKTGLKEGRGIEMSTTVLPLRDARSFVFIYLPSSRSIRQPHFFNRRFVLHMPEYLSNGSHALSFFSFNQ